MATQTQTKIFDKQLLEEFEKVGIKADYDGLYLRIQVGENRCIAISADEGTIPNAPHLDFAIDEISL